MWKTPELKKSRKKPRCLPWELGSSPAWKRSPQGAFGALGEAWKRVLQCRVPMHGLYPGRRAPLAPWALRGRMVPPEGTVSRGIPVKMGDRATLGRRASLEPRETRAPRARRGTLGLGQEDPQDPKGLQGRQDPPSDVTS